MIKTNKIKIITISLLISWLTPLSAWCQANQQLLQELSTGIDTSLPGADAPTANSQTTNKPTADNKTTNVKSSNLAKSISTIVNSAIDKKNQPPSIMYNDDDINNIDRALDAYKNKASFSLNNDEEKTKSDEKSSGKTEDNAKSYIYLSSILYRSANDWSVWINDQKISAADNKFGNELYIKSINQDKADITWTMSLSKWKILSNKQADSTMVINSDNQVEFNFSLSFNQTYMLNGNKVVEGRLIPAITLQSGANSETSKTEQ